MVAADLTGPKGEREGKREYGEEEWREMRESVLECGGRDVDRHQAKNRHTLMRERGVRDKPMRQERTRPSTC